MAETPARPAAKKTATKKAAAPAKPVREHAEYIDKAPSEVHSVFTDYIAETTGHTVPSGDVALVLRLYPLYLKSPAVVAAREVEKAERDRVKAVKEAERRERLQAKLDKIEESRTKVLAELGFDTDPFEEPEPVDDFEADPEPAPVDLAAVKREKARRLAAAAAVESAQEPGDGTEADPEPEPEPEPVEDEAAWEGDDEFAEMAGEEVTEPVTLAPETEDADDDDEGLWDESGTDAEEEF